MSRSAWIAIVAALAAAPACKGKSKGKAAPAASVPADARLAPGTPQAVTPPLPLTPTPADAESITDIPDAPGAVVKLKRLTAGTGGRPGRNDLVSIHLDGWRLSGETFASSRARHRPIQQSLSMMAPGVVAAIMTMQKGETAMIWVPSAVGYLDAPAGPPEDLVYRIELVDFEAAPATPPDVAGPPANATRTKSGLATVVLTPGTGKVHPRDHDGVTYHYTGWSSTGRIFDSSELRKRPKSTPMYREWRGLEEALALMVVGERRRVWLPRTPGATPTNQPADSLVLEQPGLPPGTLCFELALIDIQPGKPLPAAPADVAAAPADAEATTAGVRYKVLKPGTGTAHPAETDIVEIDFTGWDASGRPFDSTAIRGVPIKFVLSRSLPGWVDGIKTMVAGQTSRFWIPEAMAFKGEPGQPRGTVVFDITLRAIGTDVAPPAPAAQPPSAFGTPPP